LGVGGGYGFRVRVQEGLGRLFEGQRRYLACGLGAGGVAGDLGPLRPGKKKEREKKALTRGARQSVREREEGGRARLGCSREGEAGSGWAGETLRPRVRREKREEGPREEVGQGRESP
jgi:hypothetical protein